MFNTIAYIKGSVYIFLRLGFQTYPLAIKYVLTILIGLTFVALKGKLSTINGNDQKTLHY